MFGLKNKLIENRHLQKLRDVQRQIEEKNTMLSKVRVPMYRGILTIDINEFSRDFARLIKGTMSPEAFAVRNTFNEKWDNEMLFDYLAVLGNYLVVFADYENKALSILEERKKLETEEKILKKQLKIN